MVTTNKPKGPVRINNESAPGTTKTANPKRADVNQKRGPTTGNAGTTSKQKSFLEEKSARSSRFSELADMVMGAFGKRGQPMKPSLNAAVEPVSGNTNVGRRKK